MNTPDIHRENRQYVRIVSYDYLGSGEAGLNRLEETLKLINAQMSAGYHAEPRNLHWDWGSG